MEKLFTEFKPVTASEWKTQLEKDLKGTPFSDLIWHNENGIDIKPFYTAEDLTQQYHPAFNHSDWLICACGNGKSTTEKNASILRSLSGGASSIWVDDCSDLENLLKNVQLDLIRSSFVIDEKGLELLKNYLDKNYSGKQAHISVFIQGAEKKFEADFQKKVIDSFNSHNTVSTIAVDATSFHNKNCNAVFEIAIIYGMLVERLEQFGTSINAAPFVIKAGVNSDFFVQIAKLRAIHRLWPIFKKEYNLNNNIHLFAESSLSNKTISDRYNNLLRTTVEAMAAVAGGCNELGLSDFDVFSNSNSELAQRMTVNQQLILKDESYLDKVADIACGSYFIEDLTDKLASAALELFKTMEKQGGFYAYLNSGILEKEIAKQSQINAEAVTSGKQLVIGINKFRNEKEKTELSKQTLEHLKKIKSGNPALQYEIQNFFS